LLFYLSTFTMSWSRPHPKSGNHVQTPPHHFFAPTTTTGSTYTQTASRLLRECPHGPSVGEDDRGIPLPATSPPLTTSALSNASVPTPSSSRWVVPLRVQWAWHVINHLAHARRIIPPTRARRIHSYSSPCHPPLYPQSALWEPTTSSPSTLCHSSIQHPALPSPLPSLRDVGATVSLSAYPTKVIDHPMQLTASHTPRWAHRACHFVDSPSTLVAPFPLKRWSPPVLRTRQESEAQISNEEPTLLPEPRLRTKRNTSMTMRMARGWEWWASQTRP